MSLIAGSDLKAWTNISRTEVSRSVCSTGTHESHDDGADASGRQASRCGRHQDECLLGCGVDGRGGVDAAADCGGVRRGESAGGRGLRAAASTDAGDPGVRDADADSVCPDRSRELD
jgi:hypothetical protein